jgi:hypothetical protein
LASRRSGKSHNWFAKMSLFLLSFLSLLYHPNYAWTILIKNKKHQSKTQFPWAFEWWHFLLMKHANYCWVH